MRTYFDKHKQAIFPWITDWTDPQNHIRHQKDVNKLSFKEFFFLHPSGYQIIQYSISTLGIALFAWIAVVSWKIIPLALFSAFIAAWNVVALIRKIKNRKFTKDMTMYDLLMRESQTFEVK